MEFRNKWVLILSGILMLGAIFGIVVFVRKQSAAPVRFSSEPTQEVGNSQRVDALIEVPVVTAKNEEHTDSNRNLTIDTEYPVIALAQHPVLAKEANDVISSFVSNIKDDFQKTVFEIPTGDAPSKLTSDLTMRFTLLLLSPTIISIRFDSSEYIAGAAHPNNHVRVLNYDFTKHLILSPTDLFASSTQALPFLSTYTRGTLDLLFADMTESEIRNQISRGTEPTQVNFQEVGITKTGLIVLFAPYQVAPYARGVIEVKIPLLNTNQLTPESELVAPEVMQAIRMATENIVEAVPE